MRVFIGKRSVAPGEGENVLHVTPYGHIKSLHVGQGRAATIYDDEYDVCWLLAYSATHAVGERRDAFKHFEWLDGRDELLPAAEDYAALEVVTAASLMDSLSERGSELLTTARTRPGENVTDSFSLVDGSDASITVAVELIVETTAEAEQGWMAFLLPHTAPLGTDQLLDLVADMLPSDIDPDAVSFAPDMNGQPVNFSEVAFTWERYTSR